MRFVRLETLSSIDYYHLGRPIMIFESDFDTTLPSVDDLEENEEWSVEMALGEHSSPAPGRMISCFNALGVLRSSFPSFSQH